jgi:hypothetical protein
MPVTRYVFLDTQVFDQELFSSKSRRLDRLKELVKDRHAKIVITEITEREIVARIQQMTTTALQAVTTCRKVRETGILRELGSKFAAVFEKHDPKALSKKIEKKFRKYCKDADIVVLPLSLTSRNYASIVDDYFETRPPFKDGKRKSEFPDAIANAILKKWCKKYKISLHVVTDDNDWEGVCTKPLTRLKSLNDFFALFPDAELSKALVSGIVIPRSTYLSNEIAQAFGKIDFFLDGVDGAVEEIRDIKVEIIHAVIVEAQKNHAVAEIDCTVQFDAAIEYEFDREKYSLLRGDFEIEREHGNDEIGTRASVTAEVSFTFDPKDPTSIEEIEEISIDPSYYYLDCDFVTERDW